MIPSGAFGIIVFFLFVAPGIYYELLRDRTRLPREESTFVHVSRVLLSGTFITAFSVFLMAIVRWISPTSLLDLSDFLMRPTMYIANHAVLAGWTLLVQLALSALLAVVFSDLLTPQASKSKPIYQADAWHAISELAAEPYEYVMISIHLKSGREILGCYVGSSTELDPTKRELIVGAPLSERRAGNEKTFALDESWQRMVILGSEIESLATSYVGQSKLTQPTEEKPLHRARSWACTHWRNWQVASSVAFTLLVVCVFV